jgi:hypothetical protein
VDARVKAADAGTNMPVAVGAEGDVHKHTHRHRSTYAHKLSSPRARALSLSHTRTHTHTHTHTGPPSKRSRWSALPAPGVAAPPLPSHPVPSQQHRLVLQHQVGGGTR